MKNRPRGRFLFCGFDRSFEIIFLPMNKIEIAAALRLEVGQLEVAIKKLNARCDRLKRFVLDLEEEIAGPNVSKSIPDSKFRKVIDQVFGEKPKTGR
jgi:hypothetical protein